MSTRVRPNPTRFVISTCQEALASAVRTLYQLHAHTSEQYYLRNQQAEKLIATWATCDLWMKLYPKGKKDEGFLSGKETDALALVKSSASKVRACIGESKALGNLDVIVGLNSFPEAFWPLPEKKPKKSSAVHPFPDLVIDRIIDFSSAADEDGSTWRATSLVSHAWNEATRRRMNASAFVTDYKYTSSLLLYSISHLSPDRHILSVRDLEIVLVNPNARTHKSFLACIDAIVSFSPLRRLQLGESAINATMLLKWIGRTSTLACLEINHCVFEGFGANSLSNNSAHQQLNSITWLTITDCSERSSAKGFISFLMKSVAPNLRFLDIRTSYNLPQLEDLSFYWKERSQWFSQLAKLKHLDVSYVEDLAFVAPLTSALHILEGSMSWQSPADLEAYHAALMSIPTLRVLAVEGCTRGDRTRLPPKNTDFYRTKGKNLTGLLIDSHFTHRFVLADIPKYCDQLTHLAVFCSTRGGSPTFGSADVRELVRKLPRLRKVAVHGRHDDMVNNVAEAVRAVGRFDLLCWRPSLPVSWWDS
ncbi:hypothetical protein HK097_003071 [Rhizophlyctis rosea]|uniref:Uncharacterized protein n=1 Tax=Rhizophlyctis rosea TaxID=64517 RepID=A0AAD5SG25_9FUNG|nr:hypothetical protein HK097_003071 [Rhizophlyctis rosea]